ncbi:MAG: STN domain-containing protein, partial [Bacteroidales bacterium]|nr:STN domain-containing protein [Bacteroidales bacterium]
MRILEIKYKKRKINQHVDTSSDKNRDETYLPNMQAISNLNNIFNRLLRRFTPCNDIIKYIALILFMFIFYNFKAQVITITISMENVSLGEILQEIKKQSGKNILYNNNKVDIYKKESINIENLTLTEALDECLRNKDL